MDADAEGEMPGEPAVDPKLVGLRELRRVAVGGGDLAALSAFVIEVRFRAPQTRVILLADPDFTHDGLDELGVEILPAPVDVNMLVERLWPTTA